VHIAVYLPMLAPLLAALLAGRFVPRLQPCVAAWLLTVSAVVLAAGSTAALGLLVTVGLVRVPLVAAVADLSVRALHRDDIAPPALSGMAAIALGAVTMAAVHAFVRRIQALMRAAREADRLPGDDQVAVLEDPEVVDAFALPGRPGRIVISTGMLATLDPDGQRALLAHERAHLRHRHHWFVTATQLAAAANPLLRPLARLLDYTLERWADEEAARTTGDRSLVARAIARAALAKKSSGTIPTALGLGITGSANASALAGAGPVPRRVAALLAPPPDRRWLIIFAVVAVLLMTSGALLDATVDFHTLIEGAQA